MGFGERRSTGSVLGSGREDHGGLGVACGGSDERWRWAASAPIGGLCCCGLGARAAGMGSVLWLGCEAEERSTKMNGDLSLGLLVKLTKMNLIWFWVNGIDRLE